MYPLYLFLDFDGVAHNAWDFDEPKYSRLTHLAKALQEFHDVRIVIASTERLSHRFNRNDLPAAIKKMVVGVNPSIETGHSLSRLKPAANESLDQDPSALRRAECLQFIAMDCPALANESMEYLSAHWVAIDDQERHYGKECLNLYLVKGDALQATDVAPLTAHILAFAEKKPEVMKRPRP